MVRAVRYITERLPVLIQAVCVFAQVARAREPFLNLWNQNSLFSTNTTDLTEAHTESLREAQPLLQPVCVNKSFFTFA